MKYEWGNKNESLTLTAGSPCGEKVSLDFDKFTLQLITKMVCDIHYLKTNMAKRVNEAHRATYKKCEELEKMKEKTILGWMRRHFF
jgi:hypothetical protein